MEGAEVKQERPGQRHLRGKKKGNKLKSGGKILNKSRLPARFVRRRGESRKKQSSWVFMVAEKSYTRGATGK